MDTVAAGDQPHERGNGASRLGALLLRLSLVMIFVPIGLQKFTSYEAQAIEPFVANSPLFSWAYESFGLQATSNIIGTVEIAIGLALAVGLFARGSLVAVIGGAASIVVHLVTLSFLLTTPDIFDRSASGLPVLTPQFGQFLMKDLVLLAASIFIYGESKWARSSMRKNKA
jgi:uncharacterized membrane protein YkgB